MRLIIKEGSMIDPQLVAETLTHRTRARLKPLDGPGGHLDGPLDTNTAGLAPVIAMLERLTTLDITPDWIELPHHFLPTLTLLQNVPVQHVTLEHGLMFAFGWNNKP